MKDKNIVVNRRLVNLETAKASRGRHGAWWNPNGLIGFMRFCFDSGVVLVESLNGYSENALDELRFEITTDVIKGCHGVVGCQLKFTNRFEKTIDGFIGDTKIRNYMCGEKDMIPVNINIDIIVENPESFGTTADGRCIIDAVDAEIRKQMRMCSAA